MLPDPRLLDLESMSASLPAKAEKELPYSAALTDWPNLALRSARLVAGEAWKEPRAVLSVKKDPAKLPRNQEKSRGKRARYLADLLEWKEAEKGECIAFNAERSL